MNNRGGARPGAGAKRKEDARRATVTFRVSPATKAKIQRLHDEGYYVRLMLENTVDVCYDDLVD